MIPRRTHLAEVVLAGLVKKGLQGEALLQEFRQQMHERIDAKRRMNGRGKRLEGVLSSLVCLPSGRQMDHPLGNARASTRTGRAVTMQRFGARPMRRNG
ncbi:hypothetical protein LR69_02598 [Geobacillus sp. BCO2]|nr:hypothetical protein LR69_02598 [Geobacillus sp. BCO2]